MFPSENSMFYVEKCPREPLPDFRLVFTRCSSDHKTLSLLSEASLPLLPQCLMGKSNLICKGPSYSTPHVFPKTYFPQINSLQFFCLNFSYRPTVLYRLMARLSPLIRYLRRMWYLLVRPGTQHKKKESKISLQWSV